MKRQLTLIVLVCTCAMLANANDYSFDVKVTGKGNPILLIPGLACHGQVWDETVERLGNDYQYHVVTLPGFAGQAPIESENYLMTVGDELIDYLKTRKLKDAIVMGHSLGGFLTLYIGSEAPELVSKLVVVDGLPFTGAAQNPAATPESMKGTAEMIRKNIDTQTAKGFEETQPAILKAMMTSEEKVAIAMDWGKKSDKKTVGQAMYELYQFDLREDLKKIEAPTLVLGAWAGYKDYGVTKEMVHGNFNMQFQNLSNKEILLSEEGKHFIMWDDPEFLTDEVKRFLKKRS